MIWQSIRYSLTRVASAFACACICTALTTTPPHPAASKYNALALLRITMNYCCCCCCHCYLRVLCPQANEIDVALLDLLQQNIQAAREAGQEEPAKFMDKVRQAAMKFMVTK